MQSKRADVRIIENETLSDNWFSTPLSCSDATVNGSGKAAKCMTGETGPRYYSITVIKER